MRWLTVLLTILLLLSGSAGAQILMMEPSEELDRLDFMVGTWKVEMEARVGGKTLEVEGTSTSQYNARRTWLLTGATMRFPGAELPMEMHDAIAWNAEKKIYEWTAIDDQSTIVHGGTAAWNDKGELVFQGHSFPWPDGHTYQFRRTIRPRDDGTIEDISAMSTDGGEYVVNGVMIKRPASAASAAKPRGKKKTGQVPADGDPGQASNASR